MSKFRSITLATTALSAAAFLAAIATSNTADAALISQVSFSTDGGATFSAPVQATDGGAGDLNPGTAGALVAVFNVGGVSVILNTATGSPALAYPGLNTTFSATGTVARATILRVEFTQTNVPNSAGTNLQSAFSVSSLTSGQTITESSYAQRNNAAFGTNIVLGMQVFSATGGVNQTQGFLPSPGFTTYSETVRADITFAANTASTAGGSIILTAVPEPMTIALLGAGLLGLGVARRRRA